MDKTILKAEIIFHQNLIKYENFQTGLSKNNNFVNFIFAVERKDKSNINAENGINIATLPIGFRPKGIIYDIIATQSDKNFNRNFAQIRINSGGECFVYSPQPQSFFSGNIFFYTL